MIVDNQGVWRFEVGRGGLEAVALVGMLWGIVASSVETLEWAEEEARGSLEVVW
jgi:hypothetical protein